VIGAILALVVLLGVLRLAASGFAFHSARRWGRRYVRRGPGLISVIAVVAALVLITHLRQLAAVSLLLGVSIGAIFGIVALARRYPR